MTASPDAATLEPAEAGLARLTPDEVQIAMRAFFRLAEAWELSTRVQGENRGDAGAG